jgi:hypothetical protein
MAPTLPSNVQPAADGAQNDPERDTPMLAHQEAASTPTAAPDALAAIDKLAQLHDEASGVAQSAGEPGSAVHTTIETLVADWRAAYAQAEAEDRRLDQTQTAANRLHPKRPFDWRYQPRFGWEQDALKLWEEQIAAIDSSFGIPGLDEATNAAWRTAGAIAAQILALQPATAAEAKLKFEVILERTLDERGHIDDARPVVAFLADLERLALLECAASC